MKKILDTVLLLALPASGKSEVRKYLAGLTPGECGDDFHMGPTVQLDDFPYVHLMRCIDEELVRRRSDRLFFLSPDRPFRDARDWGTLIALINEDYRDLHAHQEVHPRSAAVWLMDRIEAAGKAQGLPARIAALEPGLRAAVADSLEREAAALLKDRNELNRTNLEGKTIVIEFARGGADGSSLPLAAPFGYRHSLAQLSPEILKRARILYIWVTPEESRRKNHERTDPNDPGSILNHGVPLEVMLKDYGCDDMDWLEQNSGKPGTVRVEQGTGTQHLPIVRFDNRQDKTSFVRKDRSQWNREEVQKLHDGLKNSLSRLASY